MNSWSHLRPGAGHSRDQEQFTVTKDGNVSIGGDGSDHHNSDGVGGGGGGNDW